MSKKAKWILIGSIVLIALLITLSKMGVFGKDLGTKVTAENARSRDIVEIVNASGKVFPVVEVKVSPDISGEITELNVQEGDTVKRGQVLARIYADIYNIQRNQAASGVAQSQAQVANARAQLNALQAQLDQAKKTFDMQKQLFDDKVISLAEFNTADANYKAAQANYAAAVASIQGSKASASAAQQSLAKARTDLSRTTITAPMDGVVSLLNVKKGESVAGNTFNVGTEILRIADMSKIEIRVDVGESDIQKVKLGDTANVTIDAYSDRKFKGVVTQIASSNNGASASALSGAASDVTQYKVYILILPDDYKDLLGKGTWPFRPGMNASADIQTRRVNNVISVPINAVTTREKPDSLKSSTSSDYNDDLDVLVFAVDSANTVKPIHVKTGIQDINYIQVTEGLKGGEKIVTGPYDVVSKTLKDKDKVKVVDKKDLFEAEKKKK